MKTVPLVLTAVLLAAPALADDGVTPLGLAGVEPTAETIRQRDAEGRVRVLREVRLNEQGDYVNHGVWRSWDAEGRLLGQGRYAWNKPVGVWNRWATADESPLLATTPFAQFEGPFLSRATYRDGKLEGVWSVFAADGRLVSEVAFHGGQRHGAAILRTATGEIYRRSQFEHGMPTGELVQRTDSGQLVTLATFEGGRRQIERVEKHATGGLKSREALLGPPTVAVEPDDPWRLRLARFEASGEELRHGAREAWWPNGQPKLRADYHLGKAVGEARWWHENGQLALQGAYEEGLAVGEWSWWRESGVRAAACRYAAGKPDGDWRLWTADGRRQSAETSGRFARRPSTSLIR